MFAPADSDLLFFNHYNLETAKVLNITKN